MNGEQGSTNTAMVPMSEMGHLDTNQFANYCADLWELVEAGTITVDEAADRMFGPEPEITFTRWTA